MITLDLAPHPGREIHFDLEPGRRTQEDRLQHTSNRVPGILIVDDDLGVRTLLDVVLRKHGFAVWLTADGYQALKAYEGHRDDIDLVLIDVRMPEIDGPQTMAVLRQVNAHLRCCFMSGDFGSYSEKELMDLGVERILYKPFKLDEVTNLVRQLLYSSSFSGRQE